MRYLNLESIDCEGSIIKEEEGYNSYKYFLTLLYYSRALLG